MIKAQLTIILVGFVTALGLVFSSPPSAGLDGKSIVASVVLVATVLLAYNLREVLRRVNLLSQRISRKGGAR